MQYIEATEEAHPIHSMQRRVMHFAEISIFLAPFITFPHWLMVLVTMYHLHCQCQFIWNAGIEYYTTKTSKDHSVSFKY